MKCYTSSDSSELHPVKLPSRARDDLVKGRSCAGYGRPWPIEIVSLEQDPGLPNQLDSPGIARDHQRDGSIGIETPASLPDGVDAINLERGQDPAPDSQIVEIRLPCLRISSGSVLADHRGLSGVEIARGDD